jgi:hypothetical protein
MTAIPGPHIEPFFVQSHDILYKVYRDILYTIPIRFVICL